MSVGRRLLLVAIVAGAAAAPAIVLRALCVGRSCERPGVGAAPVPFCSLPATLRGEIVDGYHDERSPDVVAVTGSASVAGSTGVRRDGLDPAWPSVRRGGAATVPLRFGGTGVDASARIPSSTTLDDVAPTIAEIMGIRRPHPNVRSGEAIMGIADGERPRVVLLVIMKGVGSPDIGDPSSVGIPSDVATLDVEVGSQPLDPAAAIATIGTGGLPSQHGITGTLLRNDDGQLVRAWSEDAPPSIIAALGDDLDRATEERARIGLVGSDVSDRGAIGRDWYLDGDRDDVLIGSGAAARQWSLAERLARRRGYGRDVVPDLLAVVVNDDLQRAERAASRSWERLDALASGSLTTVVTATGSEAGPGAVPAAQVAADVEAGVRPDERLIEATAVGGVFVDQSALVRTGRSADAVVRGLRAARASDGRALFADVFPGRAVTFARYC